jgi:Quinolinate phosphoribosyl transferase, N-terminal domain
VSLAPPDRATIVAAVMDELLAIEVDTGVDSVAAARLVADGDGTLAGAAVVREIMSRVGVRTRSLVEEGAVVGAGLPVIELGGPLAAIRGAAPLALTWVTRLSAVASGARPAELGNELDAYAARLSSPGQVGHDGPSFHLQIEREIEG